MKIIIGLLFLGFINNSTLNWKEIDDGMYVAEYYSPVKSSHDNSVITILKINPKKYQLDVYSSFLRYTAKEWADKENLIAVINPGMYDSESRNMGFMKQYSNLFNPNFNNDKAILCFNPKNNSIPAAQIIDREFQDWSGLVNQYESCTQSIRMVDLNGKNKWSKQAKKWSMVVVAMDKDGNILFIHSRSPYEVRQFIDILLKAPLNIKNMMYLEGGPEASMYVNHNGYSSSKVGSYETNFWEDNTNNEFWTIPNIIGISKKKKQ